MRRPARLASYPLDVKRLAGNRVIPKKHRVPFIRAMQLEPSNGGTPGALREPEMFTLVKILVVAIAYFAKIVYHISVMCTSLFFVSVYHLVGFGEGFRGGKCFSISLFYHNSTSPFFSQQNTPFF
jgi:hypothetical protein